MFSKSTCSLWWRWRSFPALNNLVNIWFSFIYIYKKKKNIAKKGKFEPLFSHKRVKAPLICPPPPEYVSIQFNQFLWSSHTLGTSLVAQTVKCLLTMRETWVQSLGREDLLEKEMATHSSILAWKILWAEEPGRTVHEVAKSQTRLSDFTFTFIIHLTIEYLVIKWKKKPVKGKILLCSWFPAKHRLY